MFPGPIFRYNRVSDKWFDNDTLLIDRDFDYFCFDYDGECQQMKTIYLDSLTNRLLKVEVARATRFARDGRNRRLIKTKIYGVTGKLDYSSHKVYSTKGKSGRILLDKKKERLEDGRMKITVKRGSWAKGYRPEMVRIR